MGIITIAFDDGYQDTYIHCSNFLAENGIKATFACPSSLIGKQFEARPVIDPAQLISLKNKGHEIASHTVTHRNLLDVLRTEGKRAAKKEMKLSRNWLKAAVGTNIESMVFPYIKDNHNDYLCKAASTYYKSARITTEDTVFNELPVKDPTSIVGIAFTRDIPMEDYNKLVDLALKKDLWFIEVFHLVSDKNTKSAHRDEPYRFFTHIDAFKNHIQYILSKKVPTMTQAEVILTHCHSCGSRNL